MKQLANTMKNSRSRFEWDVNFNEERSDTFFYPSALTPSSNDDGPPVPRRAAYLALAAAFVAGFGVVASIAWHQVLPG